MKWILDCKNATQTSRPRPIAYNAQMRNTSEPSMDKMLYVHSIPLRIYLLYLMQWQRQEFSFRGYIGKEVSPVGSRGEAPVSGDLGNFWFWGLKQFADIVYRIWLHAETIKIENFEQSTSWFLTSMFHAGGEISDSWGHSPLAHAWWRYYIQSVLRLLTSFPVSGGTRKFRWAGISHNLPPHSWAECFTLGAI